MSATNWAGLQPSTRVSLQNLLRYAQQDNIRVVLTDLARSRAEQEELYANRARNPYPVAAPGQSMHEYGLAFDCVADPLPRFVQWARVFGFWWEPSDPVHFLDLCTYTKLLAAEVDVNCPWYWQALGQCPGSAWRDQYLTYICDSIEFCGCGPVMSGNP